MKKVITFFAVFGAFLSAGQNWCGTEEVAVPDSLEQYNLEAQFNTAWRTKSTNDLIPVVLHIVRNTNGSGGIGLEDITKGIEDLNATYAALNLEFIVTEYRYIYDDTYQILDRQLNEDLALVSTSPPEPNHVNIYIADKLISPTGAGLNGFAYYPWASTDYIMLRSSAFDNESTLIHEVGHYYGLYHTHRSTSPEEYVNGSNCGTKGDLVCDTPADPLLTSTNHPGCVYNGGQTDSNGDTYVPNPQIYMSYANHQCRTMFTTGQLNRMGSYKTSHRNYFAHAGPVGVITSPSIHQNYPSTGVITLEASAIDMDGGSITSVDFYVNGVLVGSDNSSPYQYNYNFAAPGIYTVYVVTTDDVSNVHTSYDVEFIVGASVFTQSVATGNDDAEEEVATGAVSRTSSDLELGVEANAQIVGIKFNNVNVPANANIIGAYIQFTVDWDSEPEPLACAFYGEDADNAGSYNFVTNDISGRPHTTNSVTWYPNTWGHEGWYASGDAHSSQRSANLKSIVEEIIARPGWIQNNNMAFMIYGTGGGRREAESYNGDASAAPQLVIYYTMDSPLAAEMVAFDAKLENEKVHLNWKTASETNSDYFMIERSTDALHWTSISEEIPGAGTSSSEHSYQSYDNRPLLGVSYYRLRQVDFDGTTTYSDEKAVLFETQAQVFPNPFDEKITVRMPLNNQVNWNIALMDGLGKTIIEQTVEAGQHVYTLDIPANCPKGIYYLRIHQQGWMQVEKVVKR